MAIVSPENLVLHETSTLSAFCCIFVPQSQGRTGRTSSSTCPCVQCLLIIQAFASVTHPALDDEEHVTNLQRRMMTVLVWHCTDWREVKPLWVLGCYPNEAKRNKQRKKLLTVMSFREHQGAQSPFRWSQMIPTSWPLLLWWYIYHPGNSMAWDGVMMGHDGSWTTWMSLVLSNHLGVGCGHLSGPWKWTILSIMTCSKTDAIRKNEIATATADSLNLSHSTFPFV